MHTGAADDHSWSTALADCDNPLRTVRWMDSHVDCEGSVPTAHQSHILEPCTCCALEPLKRFKKNVHVTHALI